MADVEGSYALPFESVYQTSKGFVCRQVAANDPESLGLTWKLGGNFRSEVIIPLSKFRCDSLDDLGNWFAGYEHTDWFLRICEKQRYSRPTVIDLNILLQVLLGIARIQTSLARDFGWAGPVYAKMEVSGIWRTIPFVDTAFALNEYEKHGLPLMLQDKINIHAGSHQGSFIELDRLENEDFENHRILLATKIFVILALALGISPSAVVDDEGADFGSYVRDFLRAGDRARDVQKKRARRG